MAQSKQGGGTAIAVIGVLVVIGLVVKVVTFIVEQWRVTLPLAVLAAGLWFLVKWLVKRNKWLIAERELEAQRQAALSARAEAQHQAAMSGSDAGIYGEFPPVDLNSEELRPTAGRALAYVSSVPKPPTWEGSVAAAAVLIGVIGLAVSGGFQTHEESVPASALSTTSSAASTYTTMQSVVPTNVQAAAPTTSPPTASPRTLVPMPDVACMNLQAAQDLIQEAGVFYSRSQDATGQGRMQIYDRNWVVVRQDPEPGALIGEGDALLYVVKYGEPGDCS
ncbi:PASTA domain-containing protein [Smaragdicoccus niigatensis]|uniref:PASTA domain-containing protein n=1 Tax=Smaragdicoccus niigatensis TaxID=359359 RepID=UPI0003817956|nr:PASTA domain-containing protein [Smaragdicoccus niigatensis]